jgi:hypothetical protein
VAATHDSPSKRCAPSPAIRAHPDPRAPRPSSPASRRTAASTSPRRSPACQQTGRPRGRTTPSPSSPSLCSRSTSPRPRSRVWSCARSWNARTVPSAIRTLHRSHGSMTTSLYSNCSMVRRSRSRMSRCSCLATSSSSSSRGATRARQPEHRRSASPSSARRAAIRAGACLRSILCAGLISALL